MGRVRVTISIIAIAAAIAALPAIAENVPSASDTRAVLQALSVAPEAERPAWRWRLARDYAARGLYAEADGVLRVLAADTPERAGTRDFRLLHAEVMTALGDAGAAIANLDSPIVEGASETCLRRLAASARLNRHSAVRANLDCAGAALRQLPGDRRTPYLMAAVRSEMALGDEAMAEALLSRLATPTRAEAGEADFWRGVIAARRGQPALAIGHYQKAVGSPHPVAALRAEVAMTQIQVAAGSLKPAVAIARLTKLNHVWRGGFAERDLLMALGGLSDRIGDVRGAFMHYGAAVVYLPGDPGASLRNRLTARFAAIFADGGQALAPVDAFALFWDFRDFAPQGPAADAMVRRLADRLAALGLSAQAASLLEHQVYNRLQGAARGIVAVRLAALLNDSGYYARALGVLAATRRDGVPTDTQTERRLVEAAALIGAGRAAEAKALLAEASGPRAQQLRAEAAWSARDWAAVIDLLENDLPLPESTLAPDALATLLRITVAAAMDGDEALLRRLSQRYAATLRKTGMGPAFDVLTGEPGGFAPDELRAALAAAAAHASQRGGKPA